jgi:hypothetical protein
LAQPAVTAFWTITGLKAPNAAHTTVHGALPKVALRLQK